MATKPFRYVSENLYRYEPSGVYYAFIKSGRKQFRRALKTTDKPLAKRRLNAFREDVAGLTTQDGAALTFAQVATRWLEAVRHTMKESSAKRRKRCIEAVSPFFAGVTLRNITPAYCGRWVTQRGPEIAPQTFAHELNTMRTIFEFAKEQGLILSNPAKSIKRKRILPPKIDVPSRDQFRQLVAQIRASDGRISSQENAKDGADLVELLAYSGCRIDEARNLRWEHVSFQRGELTVTGGERRTKNYETRRVPMTDALSGLLIKLRCEQLPKPNDSVVKIKSARRSIETACERLNFPKFTHHDFRHFFATTCIESGVDIPTISKWLGHKDGGALAMKVYGHLRQEHSFTQIRRVRFDADLN
jgi:integrase